MNRLSYRTLVAAACLAAAGLAACASNSVLGIHYRVPEPAARATPRTVTLAFEDQRGTTAFLTPMARDELAGFSNAFALTVSKPGQAGELKGAFELAPLFREILRARLESAGIRVAAPGAPADAQFKFVLKQFTLDFGDWKWSCRMSYEAVLVRDGATLSPQTVSGSAERPKLMGKSEAEKVLSELVTDTINQMDVGTLFTQAGL